MLYIFVTIANSVDTMGILSYNGAHSAIHMMDTTFDPGIGMSIGVYPGSLLIPLIKLNPTEEGS